jgi:peptidoglycan/LPS O-acetylase OafA/YrhL
MAHPRNAGLEHLGHIRFTLAVTVALFHLWTPVFPDAGRHAVVGFFCISGFLITKIAV